jgi:DNA excision repair protein ERCC-2
MIKPLDKDFFILPEFPQELLKLLDNLLTNIEKRLEKQNKPLLKFYLLKVYFKILFFINTKKNITPDHIIYYLRKEDDYYLKIFCINPKNIFSEYASLAKSIIYFSATLLPFYYFRNILAAREKDNNLALLSPFNYKNFGLYVFNSINTYYKNRIESYEPIAELIFNISVLKKGNYIVYFPSFSFMKEVYDRIISKINPEIIICQKSKMSEIERETFLKKFDNTDNSLIAFAVLGGIFGEGIDLINDKLIGVFIVTVGIPALGNENSLIENYYNLKEDEGFNIAYKNPGFNKVMQAAGRVIRTETDKGFVILIDPRYSKQEYKELFPEDWGHYKTFSNLEKLKMEIISFWDN